MIFTLCILPFQVLGHRYQCNWPFRGCDSLHCRCCVFVPCRKGLGTTRNLFALWPYFALCIDCSYGPKRLFLDTYNLRSTKVPTRYNLFMIFYKETEAQCRKTVKLMQFISWFYEDDISVEFIYDIFVILQLFFVNSKNEVDFTEFM